jgi:hypothetical protein
MASEKANPNPNNQSHQHIADPNSVFKGAEKLQTSDFQNGAYSEQANISDQADIDIWRVTLQAGQTLTALADAPDNYTPDTILGIYNNKGQLLAYDDDSGDGYDALLSWTAQNDGQYFVAVSQYPSFPTGGGDFQNGPEYGDTGYWTGPGDYTFNLWIS